MKRLFFKTNTGMSSNPGAALGRIWRTAATTSAMDTSTEVGAPGGLWVPYVKLISVCCWSVPGGKGGKKTGAKVEAFSPSAETTRPSISNVSTTE